MKSLDWWVTRLTVVAIIAMCIVAVIVLGNMETVQ